MENKIREIVLDKTQKENRYERQLKRLAGKGYNTDHFEEAVSQAVNNLNNRIRSFVIYGDPQSGKTEMMIVLTAKLLDKGNKIVIILLNDNVDLLEQNLDRFAYSQLDPTPKNYKEILDPDIKIEGQEWVIFCKKNS